MPNLWDWFRGLLARRRGDDPQQQQQYVLPYPVAGVSLTPEQTLEVATVWACLHVISSSIASCEWQVYQPLPGGRRTKLVDDPVAYMLNTRPNPDMTAVNYREAQLIIACAFGNHYSEIVRDGGGRPAQLWPIEHDRVQPRRNAETNALEYHVTDPDGQVVVLDQRDVLHIRGPGIHGLMGDNIVARAAKSVSIAAAQDRYTAAFFGQGATPGGVLEVPGELSAERHALLKKEWAEKRKGPENAYKPLILEQGWKYNAVAVDPQKAQNVEGRQFSVEDICRWFNVPPHKVQHLLRATFGNIEHLSIEFARDTCRPWDRRLCQEVDYKLFNPKRGPWKYTCIDLAPLSTGDALSRATADSIWVQNGIKTRNEVRQREGLDDLGDEGDVLTVQLNMTTLERLINPPEPKALPSPKVPKDSPADPSQPLEDPGSAVAFENDGEEGDQHSGDDMALREQRRAETIKQMAAALAGEVHPRFEEIRATVANIGVPLDAMRRDIAEVKTTAETHRAESEARARETTRSIAAVAEQQYATHEDVGTALAHAADASVLAGKSLTLQSKAAERERGGRDAALVVAEMILDRYAKRLANRRADLIKKGDVAALSAAEAEERKKVRAELGERIPVLSRAFGRHLSGEKLDWAVELVAAGTPAVDAARRMEENTP